MKVLHIVLLLIITLFWSCETKLVGPGEDIGVPPETNDLIISEVRITSRSEDGDYRNTYVEVYNGTPNTVDLSNYGLQYASNGNNGEWRESTQITFSGELEPGAVIIIAREGTDPDIIFNPDYVWEDLKANGDDAIGLVKNISGTFRVIDQFGEPYINPPAGGAWDIAGITNASKDYVVLRKRLVDSPNTNWPMGAGTTDINSEWIVKDFDDYSNLGTYTRDEVPFAPEDIESIPPITNDLIISEVRVTSRAEDGDFRNTYVEIYNGTGEAVDLSAYGVQYASNGNGGVWDEASQLTFDGILDHGEVIVIAREGTDPDIIVSPDYIWSDLKANGDDAIGLVKNIAGDFVVIDQYGEPYDTNDPGGAWDIAGITDASKDFVLLRKRGVENPNTNWLIGAGTTVLNSEWIVKENSYFDNLGIFTTDDDDFIPEDPGGDGPPETTDLIISEVRVTSVSEEGGFRNTYVEVYNGTGVAVDLSNYGLQYASNGNSGVWDESSQLTFSGNLNHGEVIIIVRENTDPGIIVASDFTWEALTANGDDAIGLVKNVSGSFVVIDQYGEPYDAANDPGDAWDVADVREGSRDHVLLRKWATKDPNTDWDMSAGTDALNSEWIVREKSYYDNLGSYTLP
ncbi:lamin tail domain-containing protein [Tamlana sp. 2201CG12-4]|uniref:lamin tail domain-containing protein n=1 Tax=Tamlana sp. 2201CG12-4 TaxID=3112582 RepID=UPI002DBC3C8F|nr:lamin tail domain-containing protein [Tamlana sp. 2201CG12-4]MEC3908682.1 lamin tail domain-containing protein [Tamlana sp. 2201CG12-4]